MSQRVANLCPSATSSARSVLWLKSSPFCTAQISPLSSANGWWPSATSMTLRRRAPIAAPSVRYVPRSSGPRCVIASVIASRTVCVIGGRTSVPTTNAPAIPHIRCIVAAGRRSIDAPFARSDPPDGIVLASAGEQPPHVMCDRAGGEVGVVIDPGPSSGVEQECRRRMVNDLVVSPDCENVVRLPDRL